MPGYGARYWSDRTAKSRRRSHAKFRGAATADAVVIGGGFTGCAAAYVLANGGFDVILLEADALAEGGTAGSPGIIVPQPDGEYRSVEQLAGRRAARTAWKEASRGAVELAATLRKLKIGDVTPAPVVINARTSDDVERLRREQGTRKAAGLAAPFLGAEAARALTHAESMGGIRLQSGFLFDPVRAALGFAAAAEKQGARIFEGSAVRRTRFTRKTADVLLASGTIRTKLIVVATGGPGAVFGQLRRHVREQQGFGVVTAPLPAAVRKEIGAVKASMTEPDAAIWTRPMPDHRILFAGAASRPSAAARDRQNCQAADRAADVRAVAAVSGRVRGPGRMGVERAGGLDAGRAARGSARIAITPFISSRWRSGGTAMRWPGGPPGRPCGPSGERPEKTTKRSDSPDICNFGRGGRV